MTELSLRLVVLSTLVVACSGPGGFDRIAESPNRRIAERNITFFEARVARDPYGARDRVRLAALYLARAREAGSEQDLGRAEELARESRRIRSRRNPDAASVLAGTLMAQHRFGEAHDIMREAVTDDPDDPVARATLGEIALELGRYPESDSLFGAVALRREEAGIGPRYARWLELHGHSGEARALLERVRARLDGGFRVPPQQLAWLDLRLGELATRNGRPDLGEQAFRRGLELAPGDAALLTALARLRGYDGDWNGAVTLAEAALGARFEPATLALLAEGYHALGDTARSAEFVAAMSLAVSRQPNGFHRGWALFLLDHGGNPTELLARAEREHQARHDVYGHDLLAWALHRTGHHRAARSFADSALLLGTRDASLYYHAGIISLAAGDTAVAVDRLTMALGINPRFHPTQATHARATLREIGW